LVPTDRMIEILVLLKGFDGQLPINDDQFSIKCSDELHSTNFTQQLCSGLIYCFILCSQANAEIAGAEFDVFGVDKIVSLAHCLTLNWGERGSEELDLLEENNYLVCGPTFNIRWGGCIILEGISFCVVM